MVITERSKAITKYCKKDDNIKKQDHIRIISESYQHQIKTRKVQEQDQNKTIFQNDATATGSRAFRALATELTSILGI